MRNILKTLLYIPIIILLGSVFYLLLFSILIISYFVGLLMLPTKLHSYLNKLDEYKRIKK